MNITNNVIYKPSMFNHSVNNYENGSLILFNSYLGSKGIVSVPKSKKGKIKKWLENDYVFKEDVANDSDFIKLSNMGYFVESTIDEKQRRDTILSELRDDSTLRLVIHTSKACNFRCKYCYLHFNDDTLDDDNINPDIQEGIVNFVRDNIQNFSSVHVDWFGGEPLLAINAIQSVSEKLIDICRKARKPYEAVITTNGYLLTPQNIDILIKAKIRHFAITIDGVKEQHDSLRVLKNGCGTFDKIISNLVYIRDNVKTRTISISLRSNVTLESIGLLDNYYNYYNQIFGHDSRFYLFVRPVKDLGGDSVNKISSLLFQKNNIDFSIVLDKLSGIVDKIKFDANFMDLNVGGIRCFANNKNRYTVGVDGMVSKCDESIPEVGVGKLDKFGRMQMDTSKLNEWMKTSRVGKKCDECFYSCCCFMDPCPKSRVNSGQESCPSTYREIDSLILLYVKSYTTEVL